MRAAHAEELTLLANLARYGQDSDSEVEALQLLRERFRGTKHAALAAFALGRLEFDNHGAYAEAAEWFRIYLRESRGGSRARSERALARSPQRSGDGAAMREQAQRYLAEYPDGPHAELARSLTARSWFGRRRCRLRARAVPRLGVARADDARLGAERSAGQRVDRPHPGDERLVARCGQS